MSLFRLTVRGASGQIPTAPIQQQRVYRWGSNWGIYRGPSQQNRHGMWRAEKRTTLESSADQLFERVEVLAVQAPPLHTDDVWDEEVIVSNNVEYNGLVSICASASEIKNWCQKARLPVPATLEECTVAEESAPTFTRPPKVAAPQQYPPKPHRGGHGHGHGNGHHGSNYNSNRDMRSVPRRKPNICLIDS